MSAQGTFLSREAVIERLRKELRRLMPMDDKGRIRLVAPGEFWAEALLNQLPLVFAYQALVNPSVDSMDDFVRCFVSRLRRGHPHPLMVQTAAVLLEEALAAALGGYPAEERYKKIANALGLGGFAGERSSARARPAGWRSYRDELSEIENLMTTGMSSDVAENVVDEAIANGLLPPSEAEEARRYLMSRGMSFDKACDSLEEAYREDGSIFFDLDRDSTARRYLKEHQKRWWAATETTIKAIYDIDRVEIAPPRLPTAD
jgi:uncharacterized protein YoaH (UPF0181 family)